MELFKSASGQALLYQRDPDKKLEHSMQGLHLPSSSTSPPPPWGLTNVNRHGGGSTGLIACAVEGNSSMGVTKCTFERGTRREEEKEESKKCSEEPAAACDGQMWSER